MTDGDSRLDSQLNIVKNMDDFLLYGRNMEELKEKLEKFLSFAAEKNLKFNTKKFIIDLRLISVGTCGWLKK